MQKIKGKKSGSPWQRILWGSGAALLFYLATIFLITGIMHRGGIAEEKAFPLLLILCLCSSFLGGWIGGRANSWGPLPGSAAADGLFALYLLLIGLCGLNSAGAKGEGLALLGSILAGALLASLLAARKKKKRSGRP